MLCGTCSQPWWLAEACKRLCYLLLLPLLLLSLLCLLQTSHLPSQPLKHRSRSAGGFLDSPRSEESPWSPHDSPTRQPLRDKASALSYVWSAHRCMHWLWPCLCTFEFGNLSAAQHAFTEKSNCVAYALDLSVKHEVFIAIGFSRVPMVRFWWLRQHLQSAPEPLHVFSKFPCVASWSWPNGSWNLSCFLSACRFSCCSKLDLV